MRTDKETVYLGGYSCLLWFPHCSQPGFISSHEGRPSTFRDLPQAGSGRPCGNGSVGWVMLIKKHSCFSSLTFLHTCIIPSDYSCPFPPRVTSFPILVDPTTQVPTAQTHVFLFSLWWLRLSGALRSELSTGARWAQLVGIQWEAVTVRSPAQNLPGQSHLWFSESFIAWLVGHTQRGLDSMCGRVKENGCQPLSRDLVGCSLRVLCVQTSCLGAVSPQFVNWGWYLLVMLIGCLW